MVDDADGMIAKRREIFGPLRGRTRAATISSTAARSLVGHSESGAKRLCANGPASEINIAESSSGPGKPR
jgi:hypothetical protein